MHAQDNDVACCAVQVGAITGSKILRIMKGLGLAPEIPEDLYHLIKKAVSMRKHLELFRKDKDGKFRLILVESRIHRLARYYKVLMRRHLALACSLCAVSSRLRQLQRERLAKHSFVHFLQLVVTAEAAHLTRAVAAATYAAQDCCSSHACSAHGQLLSSTF